MGDGRKKRDSRERTHGANAEGAGDEPSQPLAAELLERPEQLADVRWDQGCRTLKDGGSAPPLPVH